MRSSQRLLILWLAPVFSFNGLRASCRSVSIRVEGENFFLLKAFNGSFPGWHAEHAGLTETSLMLHLKPDLVREIRPEHSRPPLSGVYLHPIDPMQISDRGVLADTTKSSAELGAALFEHICTELELLLDKPHGMATK